MFFAGIVFSHYINLQALRQTTTTASHYVLLWRCLHFKKVKIQGFLTFLFSIFFLFKGKNPPQTHNKPNNIFTTEKSPQIHLHCGRFSPHLHQWPMNGQGWREDIDGWMGGKVGSHNTLLLPTLMVLGGRWGQTQAPKHPTHRPTAKPAATSLPSTVSLAPALQSNVKAEIAT